MGKLLIVGNRSLGGSELAELIEPRVRASPCAAHLVVPVPSPVASAVAVGAHRQPTWHPRERDIDHDRRAAQEQLEFGLDWLARLGASATGELSLDPDTPSVVAHLVGAEAFDEVIVSTLPTKVSRSAASGSPVSHRPQGERAGHRRVRRLSRAPSGAMSETALSGQFAHRSGGCSGGCDE